jgi:hypothetical protein
MHNRHRFHKNKLRRIRRELTIQNYDPANTLDVFTKPLMVVDEQLASAMSDCSIMSTKMVSHGDWPAILLALALMITLNLMCMVVFVWYWLRRRFVRTVNIKC